MRFRSRPSEIEAIRWTGDNADEIRDFGAQAMMPTRDAGFPQGTLILLAGKDGAQGEVPVPTGHWIVRSPGDLTDHWPVDPDYFEAKYEEVPS